jgi:hypothetical protein
MGDATQQNQPQHPSLPHQHNTHSGGIVAASHSSNFLSILMQSPSLYSMPTDPLNMNWTLPSSPPSTYTSNLPTSANFFSANAVVNANGISKEYAQLKVDPRAKEWLQGCTNKIGRLANGIPPHMTDGTNTSHFIKDTDMPADHHATYLRIVAALKPHKEAKECHVCFTIGGNQIDYAGKTYTPTANLTTIKMHANSVFFTKHAKFMTIDIKNFYLRMPMPCYEYMQIPVKDIPQEIMDHYHLAPPIHNGYVLVKILQGHVWFPSSWYHQQSS